MSAPAVIDRHENKALRAKRRIRGRYGWLMPMIPGMAFLIVISVYPTIYSLNASFYRWNLAATARRSLVGLRNYQLLLADPSFWHSVGVTVTYVFIVVALELAIGLGVALLFFRRFPGDHFLRALLILPMVVAPVVVGLLWRYMLNAQFGVVNYLAELVGFERVDFLGNTALALPTLILIDVWQWTPFTFLILLAALQGVPEDVIEAARIDGARSIRIFFDHILPMIRYPVAVALVLRMLDAFRVYDIIFMTTRGGPVDATQTLSWQIYDVGFKSFDIGYAAAYSWLMLILVVVVATAVLKIMFRRTDFA
jgi:multiple sugar transport system permease protein